MLAVVYQRKGEISVKDVPVPKIKPDEILLKVKAEDVLKVVFNI